MYWFAAQQTSTVKLLALFERFQTEERVLRVNLRTLLNHVMKKFQVSMVNVTASYSSKIFSLKNSK